MQKIIKFSLTALVTLLALDFIGFIAWGMSGQLPVDGFFLGTITKHILQAIFF